ncbi:MAG: HNH endonuclease [Magnetospirillum sp.]|nr:HNH endonuclease [Magnetospirillum sp.]
MWTPVGRNVAASVDEHHWGPKSVGGRTTSHLHKICHRALHARFNEAELAAAFSTPQAVQSDPEMAVFLHWVRKRPPEYLDWPKDRRRH